MAHLGRNIGTCYPLRRTSLCAESPTILDDETWEDVKCAVKEIAEEIWSPITLRNYESEVVDPVYGESLNKTWIDYNLYAFVNVQPTQKELTDLGIREEISMILKVLITEVDRVLTPVSKAIDTDDRVIYDGVTYSVYKVVAGQQYRNKGSLWTDIVCKIYSAQGPVTLP